MSNKTQILHQISTKYDAEMEKAVFEWISAVMGQPDLFSGVSGPLDLHKKLKDGVLLCELMNKIQPVSIKCFTKNAMKPFQQRENIELFNEAMRSYGVKPEYVFVTTDLFDKQNMVQVLIGLRALGTKASLNGVMPKIKM